MNDSISGTATRAPLLVRFVLNRPIPDAAARRREELAKQRDLKRKTQLEVEQLALEYARVMLERDIHNALELEKTDPALAFKLRGRIMDRAIGKVPQVDEEAAAKRKGGSADALVDFLHAISQAHSYPTITHQPGTPVPGERDVTPGHIEHGGEWFEQYPTSTEEDNPE